MILSVDQERQVPQQSLYRLLPITCPIRGNLLSRGRSNVQSGEAGHATREDVEYYHGAGDVAYRLPHESSEAIRFVDVSQRMGLLPDDRVISCGRVVG